MNIMDYKAPCGTVIIPGTRTKLYLVCSCDVAVWPDFKPVDPASPGDGITLDGDIVLKPGKKWAVIDIISDTGNIKNTMVGQKGGKNFTNSLDYKLMKTIGADEWAQLHANGCFVGMIASKNGTLRVFGAPDMPAWIESAAGDGGLANDSEAAWTFQIMDNTGGVCPVYQGSLDISTTNPEITSALTASGAESTPFSYSITATNSPTSYGATGLPAGLSVNSSTGAITGTPTAAGSYNVTISASNADGSDSRNLVITIVP